MTDFNEISKSKLHRSYYLSDDVVTLAHDLIGKVVVTNINGHLCRAMIVETEAYRGLNDKACHANNGKRTPRNEIMYAEGGHAYVYLCYGIHHLFNVVTNVKDRADAVLIRALHPIEGLVAMTDRLPKKRKLLLNGPGVLTKAMGIRTNMSGMDLLGNEIWLENGVAVKSNEITVSKRVGVEYAEEDADLLWRFYITDDPNISVR